MGKQRKWSKLEKLQKDKAAEPAKYRETDEIQREAEFEREGSVKVRHAGDIDFEDTGTAKPVKKRHETVEEADLEEASISPPAGPCAGSRAETSSGTWTDVRAATRMGAAAAN
jgi:hypothetical protein